MALKILWLNFVDVLGHGVKVDSLQVFKLPRPILCIGGVMQVELLGRVQTQQMDNLYYIWYLCPRILHHVKLCMCLRNLVCVCAWRIDEVCRFNKACNFRVLFREFVWSSPHWISSEEKHLVKANFMNKLWTLWVGDGKGFSGTRQCTKVFWKVV